MSDEPTYSVRFDFVPACSFGVDEAAIPFELAGRPALLRSPRDDQPLREASATVIKLGGFPDADEAHTFGARLRRAATLTGARMGFGLDVGDDLARTRASDALRKQIFDKTGSYLRDRIHGVDVFQENVPSRIIIVEGKGVVTMSPQVFLTELKASFEASANPMATEVEHGVRLCCEAYLGGDGLARMILAIAAVEALVSEGKWTVAQNNLLSLLLTTARSFPNASSEEIREIVERIETLHRISIRQGCRRLLIRLKLSELWPRWDRLYEVRSGVLHGDLPSKEARAVVDEATRLSQQIVLAAVRAEQSA